MELVERYVAAVEAELPRRSRADVGLELRTLLAESVEERAAGGTPLREAQLEVLGELGPPREVAARYAGPQRALIGPGMLPALWRTLAIVAAVLGGLSLVAWLWQVGGEEDPAAALLSTLPEVLTQFLSNFLEVAGLVLLVFAVVEWLGLRRRGREEPWDPSSLESVPADGDRVNRWGALAGAAGSVFLILWLLFFRDSLGAVVSSQGRLATLDVLGPGLLSAVPWLVAVWSAELVVRVGLVVRGRWSTAWRALDLATRFLGLAVLGLLVASREPLLATTSAEALDAGVAPHVAERLATELLPLLDRFLRFALLAGAVGAVVGIVRSLAAIIRGQK